MKFIVVLSPLARVTGIIFLEKREIQ